jgi:hypothetical protein
VPRRDMRSDLHLFFAPATPVGIVGPKFLRENFRITYAGVARGAFNSRRVSPYNWWRFCFFNSIGSHSVKRVNQYLCIEISVDTYNFAPTHSNHMHP